MNITKERQELLDHFDEMMKGLGVWIGPGGCYECAAIRSLIESSGEKASAQEEGKATPSRSEIISDADARRLLSDAGYFRTEDDIPAPLPGPSPELKQVVDYITRPLFGMEWVDSLLRACRELNKGKPEHQKWIDEARAILKGHAAPPPAPLPKEVEEAMARMPDAILCAYAFRLGHTRATIPSVSEATYDNEADEAALAVIRAALRPKVVTREWLVKLGECFIYLKLDEAQAILRELGIEVGP